MAALTVDKLTTSKIFMLQADEDPVRYVRRRHGVEVSIIGYESVKPIMIRYDEILDQTQGLQLGRDAQKEARAMPV